MAQKQQRILIVDDLPDWRKTLSGLLLDAGYQAEAVGSPSDALVCLNSHRFDLAVVDMRLDETDEDNTEGLSLAEEIRRTRPATKVIIITGYGTPERLKRAIEPDEQGRTLADDYVPKTQTEDLIRSVERVLAR